MSGTQPISTRLERGWPVEFCSTATHLELALQAKEVRSVTPETIDEATAPLSTGLSTDVLSTFELCRDTELAVISKALEDVLDCSGSVESLSTGTELDPSVVRAVELTDLTLCTVRFGAESRIVIDPFRAYGVTVPISGQVVFRYGSREVLVGPGRASVMTSGSVPYMPRWLAGAEVLVIKIRHHAVENALEAMIDRPVHPSLVFDPSFDFTTASGQSWLSILGLLTHELATPGSLTLTSRRHQRQLESLLISTLVRAQPHNYSEHVEGGQPTTRSRTVRHAVEAIEEAPEEPWTLMQLAEITGVSGRRLQQGFADQLGLSPMQYLQHVRLDRVHRDLLDDAGTVADLSARWGFTHLGRFAGVYRARYGEPPSQTRRRNRARTLTH